MRKILFLFFLFLFPGCAAYYFHEGLERANAGLDEIAIAPYTKSCNLGEMAACNNLGVIYVKQNNIMTAFPLYQKACNGGSPHGCLNLAEIFITYHYGTLDKAKSAASFACSRGLERACDSTLPQLVQIEMQQKTLSKSNSQIKHPSHYAFQRKNVTGPITQEEEIKCFNGNYSVCDDLAEKYFNLKNYNLANVYASMACNNKYYLGCFTLSKIELARGNLEYAIRLKTFACSNGVRFACSSNGNNDSSQNSNTNTNLENVIKGAINYNMQRNKE